MIRHAFTIVSAVSLLLSGAAVVLHNTVISVQGPPIWFCHDWATNICTGDFDKGPDFATVRNLRWHVFRDGGFVT